MKRGLEKVKLSTLEQGMHLLVWHLLNFNGTWNGERETLYLSTLNDSLLTQDTKGGETLKKNSSSVGSEWTNGLRCNIRSLV